MSHSVALGYTRLSQDSDTSIADQKKEIRALAEEQNFELRKIYDDGEHASGFNTDRPEYQKLLTHLDQEDIDILLVRDTDRLARDKRERLTLMLSLEDYEAELWTTAKGEPVDLDDDDDFLLEMLRAHFDDVIKQREIDKAKRRIRERIENGYYHGRPPYGLQFNDEKTALVPDSDEFDEVLKVFDLRDSGYSYREIATETGISRGTVSRILDRREKYEQHRDEWQAEQRITADD